MAISDAFLQTVRATLPDEIHDLIDQNLRDVENGNFFGVLSPNLVKQLVGIKGGDGLSGLEATAEDNWNDTVFRRLNVLLNTPYFNLNPDLGKTYKQHFFFLVAIAALQLFVQISVTGPHVVYPTASLLLPSEIAQDEKRLRAFRSRLVASRAVDGIAAYRLTPNPELLCLADTILASPSIKKNVVTASWAQMRTMMMHQRILSESSSTLQDQIYESLLEIEALPALLGEPSRLEARVELHIEKAAVDLYHGFDRKARENLSIAQNLTGLDYALTGRLGKRTKYQDQETSQLVVLARSQDTHASSASRIDQQPNPRNLDLEDDTLLNSISFSSQTDQQTRLGLAEEANIPRSLQTLDPNEQPRLSPHDSTILLLLASSITSTSPVDGLTREETLPYALRVLDGGSSNWQIYTQALLIRSRIEGYKSRTAERGLLQLQALVDQIIADTDAATAVSNDDNSPQVNGSSANTSFLPLPQAAESASASQRLRYVHLLSVPTRWELQTELAARWTSMGGLRSALEIYERLEMWPEAALCWAATDQEEKAKRVIKRQLNYAASDRSDDAAAHDDTETWDGTPRDPPPADAPRLYCILADLDQDPQMWLKAWDVSNQRYARAQRSLGRHYLAHHQPDAAANSYAKSLKVNQLNSQSWFAYGCCLLELSRFQEAVEAFARTVQLDDHDAEAWSNLAAALVKRGPRKAHERSTSGQEQQSHDDDGGATTNGHKDPQQHLRDALRAFKRAATLKQDAPRIYDNVLTVAASLEPPAYPDVVAAQRQIIALRGGVEGESCVDEDIVNTLVRHVVSTYPSPSSSAETEAAAMPQPQIPDAAIALQTTYRPGSVPALVIDLVTKRIQPLITRSSRLWLALSTLSIWLNRPGAALEAHEKAWRIVLAGEKWEQGNEAEFEGVTQATLDLVDAYESLGGRTGPAAEERTEGLTGRIGEFVAKDWKFKARSAIRGVLGRAREFFEGTEGYVRLEERIGELKGG